jgi:hypothetical protein
VVGRHELAACIHMTLGEQQISFRYRCAVSPDRVASAHLRIAPDVSLRAPFLPHRHAPSSLIITPILTHTHPRAFDLFVWGALRM